MTKRDQYNFILHKILPAIEQEGLTIKTRRDGELTIPPGEPSVTRFVNDTRQRITATLQRMDVPSSPYGAI